MGTFNLHAPPTRIKQGWADYADELAAWFWAHLVNRTDVWGGYLPLVFRGQGGDKTVTKPRVALRGQVRLTPGVLVRHARGRDAGQVAGLHSTSPDNTSRWGALDIDAHDGGNADPATNLAAALAWYRALEGLGFTPLLCDSNGRGGFHLLALFNEPVPTPKVFAFLKWLVRDHRQHGLAVAPEQFPKQPSIQPDKFGNWLRVPGRHHSNDHWSRVWDGKRW